MRLGNDKRGGEEMTNLERLRELSAEKMADTMERWIVLCSNKCPALAQCRGGMSCRQALLAWLKAEVDPDER